MTTLCCGEKAADICRGSPLVAPSTDGGWSVLPVPHASCPVGGDEDRVKAMVPPCSTASSGSQLFVHCLPETLAWVM